MIELDQDGEQLPIVLARLHRSLPVGAAVSLCIRHRPPAPITIPTLLAGAGFHPTNQELGRTRGGHDTVHAVRARTLADTVGPGMQILFCGFNPSLHAADSGVAYSGPGNRFWPAALAAGLVSRDRDPVHALTHHGIGLTDLVKRATPRASELATGELHDGLGRVDDLSRALRPAVVCMVGLGAWRAVTVRTAPPGHQTPSLGGAPVYVMPSTSGLNARSSLDELVGHLEAVKALANTERGPGGACGKQVESVRSGV
ncbi:MAG: mismatch-specific DNA-glycosylase [Acidimicrobiales bacterium]|nr:mismatch-specific DNA-glycosylase [Acidimicrobiales bacterium]